MTLKTYHLAQEFQSNVVRIKKILKAGGIKPVRTIKTAKQVRFEWGPDARAYLLQREAEKVKAEVQAIVETAPATNGHTNGHTTNGIGGTGARVLTGEAESRPEIATTLRGIVARLDILMEQVAAIRNRLDLWEAEAEQQLDERTA